MTGTGRGPHGSRPSFYFLPFSVMLRNTPSPPRPRIFTPVDRMTNVWLRLLIADQDIPRARRWTRIVTDIPSGRRYRVWQKSCGSPRCLCDAYAVGIA